jgi:sporulation protein YlmC with PRC-barrel domain
MFSDGLAAGTQVATGKGLSRRSLVASEERLRELEEKYEGYTVYDNGGNKIGKVDDLFVDESDKEEYIGVKMGFLGTKSTLIPTEIVRINENDRTIEVSESKDRVKDAPSFSDDEDVTAEYEERIRSHFGLKSLGGGSGGGGQDARDDAQYGERRDSDAGAAGYLEPGGSPGSEGYRQERGGLGETETQYGGTGSSDVADASAGEGSSGPQPTTTRQTEETETFQEGGRTKVRRRIIREEVVDADDQGTSS